MEREEFIKRLGDAAPINAPAAETEIGEAQSQPEPLAADAAAFWQGTAIPEELSGEASGLVGAAALPKRLGKFPFWRGRDPLLETMTPIYERAARHATNVFVGIVDEE